MIRYPAPLAPGDVVGVTAPSSGVAASLVPRLEVALDTLRSRGLEPRLGRCLDGSGIVSAPADERAAELTAMLLDPQVRAVVPPWGGEIAIDLLDRLDWDALAADPTWLVGFSDVSTLLLPLTVLTGVATLHGQNLMDTPYRVPTPLASWLDVVAAPTGSTVVQGASERHRAHGYDDWEADPAVVEPTYDSAGTWTRLDAHAGGELAVSGRLIGGCLEAITHLVGTPFGDVPRFAREHAPEGTIVYLECAESNAADTTRRLFQLRYAGWFDDARAVLVGRTGGADLPGWTQHDAVRHALGDLGVPVVGDVDCGHVPPHLALVNGALATVTHDAGADRWQLSQQLVP
ncbi:S66 family peptidase [Luteimicrobium sp. DT211]|uniref:S66 family peptidase n=1 Tax=Luteimicrobium sp. DT211 TaxID=3393412 RepID=UPI003CED94CB